MLANQNNILNINKYNNDGHTFNMEKYFKMFLDQKGTNVAKTASEYGRDVMEYFEMIYGKSVFFITGEEIANMDIDEVLKYQKMLVKKKLVNKTVNKKITAIKEFMKYLSSLRELRYLDIRTEYFDNIIRKSENTQDEYDAFTESEVFEMVKLIRESGQNNANMKANLIQFCMDTGMRIGAVLNLNWSNFEEKDEYVVIKGVDKGNKDYRPKIRKGLYKMMLEDKVDGQDKVFTFSKMTVNRLINNAITMLGLEDDHRKLVFHSIRKAAGTHVYKKTGDLRITQRFLSHSKIETTMKYIRDEEVEVFGAFSDAEDVKENLIDEVDMETLKRAIKSMPKSEQFRLNLAIHSAMKDS